MMELRFENGVPSRIWEIPLPRGFFVEGCIKVALANNKNMFVTARYKVRPIENYELKQNMVELMFAMVCDGKAVLNVSQRDKRMLEGITVKTGP